MCWRTPPKKGNKGTPKKRPLVDLPSKKSCQGTICAVSPSGPPVGMLSSMDNIRKTNFVCWMFGKCVQLIGLFLYPQETKKRIQSQKTWAKHWGTPSILHPPQTKRRFYRVDFKGPGEAGLLCGPRLGPNGKRFGWGNCWWFHVEWCLEFWMWFVGG